MTASSATFAAILFSLRRGPPLSIQCLAVNIKFSLTMFNEDAGDISFRPADAGHV